MELPPLPRSTILLVEVGSTAHGTGIPGGEDYDQLGVVVEVPDQVLGLDDRGFRTVMQRTQPEGVRSGPGDVDRTLYSLRRFVRLAASGNPSILMSLWAPIDHATTEGHELQGLGDAFIGRHVVPRYRGYMQSQAQRLLGTRGGGHEGCVDRAVECRVKYCLRHSVRGRPKHEAVGSATHRYALIALSRLAHQALVQCGGPPQ